MIALMAPAMVARVSRRAAFIFFSLSRDELMVMGKNGGGSASFFQSLYPVPLSPNQVLIHQKTGNLTFQANGVKYLN